MKTIHAKTEHDVTVATFQDLDDAARFCRSLDKKGIQASIHDERPLQRYFLLASQKAGIHVQVPPAEVEAAKLHLKKWEHTVSEQHRAFHCPVCNSSRVEYPQQARNFILTTLMSHLAVALGIEKRRFYCKHCHHTWIEEPQDTVSRIPAHGRAGH